MRIEYPKIETVWSRDEKSHKVVTDRPRFAEFGIINNWHVTEKIDGTNVRVMMDSCGDVTFGGRTDAAQMPCQLLEYLTKTFTIDKMHDAFIAEDGVYPDCILFGEGYGPKIQKVGRFYNEDVAFRLFDVRVGEWWLERESVIECAEKLGIKAVPVLPAIHSIPKSIEELDAIISQSVAAQEDGGSGLLAEGIVSRSYPLLLTRSRQRVMWKLKRKDFIGSR